MTKVPRGRRRSRATVVVGTAALMLAVTAPPSHASVLQVWVHYAAGGSLSANMAACALLSNVCLGLQDGSALGVVDATLAVDEIDDPLGLDYTDDFTVPPPESATNQVVEVLNNTSLALFIGPGNNFLSDDANGTGFYVPAYGDETGQPVDASTGFNGSNAAPGSLPLKAKVGAKAKAKAAAKSVKGQPKAPPVVNYGNYREGNVFHSKGSPISSVGGALLVPFSYICTGPGSGAEDIIVSAYDNVSGAIGFTEDTPVCGSTFQTVIIAVTSADSSAFAAGHTGGVTVLVLNTDGTEAGGSGFNGTFSS